MKWTAAEEDLLQSLWPRPDMSVGEIADKLGRSKLAIKKKAYALRLPYRGDPIGRNGVDTSKDNEIARLYCDGLGYKTIARKLRISEGKVRKALERKGVRLRADPYATRKHVYGPPDAIPKGRLSEDQITDIYDDRMYTDNGMDLKGWLDERDRIRTREEKERRERLRHGARSRQSTRGMCGIVDDRPTVCQAIPVKW